MKLLITGGAGFIGSNFILDRIEKGDKVLNLDKLTYSGNLDNLISVQDNENYSFIQGDIGDKIRTQKSFPNSVRTPWLISPQRRMLIGRW